MKTPQKKGMCLQVKIVKPKKPNSCFKEGSCCTVCLISGVWLLTFRGEGTTFKNILLVMVRGGRAKDTPGIQFHLIRGKYDFTGKERVFRTHRKSKFGQRSRRFGLVINYENMKQVFCGVFITPWI
jgi:small subunit ribosomal protein S12